MKKVIALLILFSTTVANSAEPSEGYKCDISRVEQQAFIRNYYCAYNRIIVNSRDRTPEENFKYSKEYFSRSWDITGRNTINASNLNNEQIGIIEPDCAYSFSYEDLAKTSAGVGAGLLVLRLNDIGRLERARETQAIYANALKTMGKPPGRHEVYAYAEYQRAHRINVLRERGARMTIKALENPIWGKKLVLVGAALGGALGLSEAGKMNAKKEGDEEINRVFQEQFNDALFGDTEVSNAVLCGAIKEAITLSRPNEYQPISLECSGGNPKLEYSFSPVSENGNVLGTYKMTMVQDMNSDTREKKYSIQRWVDGEPSGVFDLPPNFASRNNGDKIAKYGGKSWETFVTVKSKSLQS